ncbi:MAG: ribosome small subunit-dependent GTPase A [Candidatus Krumholzibacteria bacterium]|nr:ribosome small subunit-dependent GTPase A [Candidatus Krumholzibacteria bacterium]
MTAPEKATGFVIRIKGSDHFVVSGREEVRCSLRGRFRLREDTEAVLPIVGDNVEFRWEKRTCTRGPTGLIVEIFPRRSIFARSDPSGRKRYRILGANLDYVFLVFAVREPRLNLRLLDRMLVAAGCGRMTPIICINKMDLADNTGRVRKELSLYLEMGYEVILCSALTGSGLDRLKEKIVGRHSILAGPSGGGKTSLVSALQPGLELNIGSVSASTGKGRHTTTHFELHPLDIGGYLGDTPGIREFGIWGVSRKDLSDFFLDFKPFHGECRFLTCTHSHEPDCGIKNAVEKGLVSSRRYESYLRILETLPERLCE